MSHASARPAVSDDLEQILEIEKLSYPQPWGSDHFIEEMKKPFTRLMVLTDDETDTVVIGYIIYWIHAEAVSLLNITVNPKWRGLGFAQKLMSLMINETVRDEISHIILEVRASNTPAIALYQKLGFRQTHERKKFYHDGETALVMELKTSELSSVIQ
jgi:ribosomal-protein-alanine N-acetyltransferase